MAESEIDIVFEMRVFFNSYACQSRWAIGLLDYFDLVRRESYKLTQNA
jgi:hypothetical protein